MGWIRELWGRGLVGKVVVIAAGLLGLFVVCCVIGAILGPQQQGTVGTAIADVPTIAALSAGLTETPVQTNTPEPSSTPAPSATPTPVPPTATPIPPITLEGTGQTVTDPFTPPAAISRVILAHEGSRNFIVQVFRPDGTEVGLVNKIGRYAGIRALLATDAGEYYFEVNADGKWLIRIEPMTGEASAAQGLEGSGDYVSGVFDPVSSGPTPYNVSHKGERNFIVHLYCAGGEDSVQNEIGKVSGSVVVRFSDGPCFWDVQADGDWTLKPK